MCTERGRGREEVGSVITPNKVAKRATVVWVTPLDISKETWRDYQQCWAVAPLTKTDNQVVFVVKRNQGISTALQEIVKSP